MKYLKFKSRSTSEFGPHITKISDKKENYYILIKQYLIQKEKDRERMPSMTLNTEQELWILGRERQ